MNRQHQLKYCKVCNHKKHDFQKGIICSLTDDYPAFETTCDKFDRNQDFFKIEKQRSQDKIEIQTGVQIKGIKGLSTDEINKELSEGAKFVMYQYCVSIIVMTFKRPTDIYFVKSGKSSTSKGLIFSLITFLFGWWGIPWGPIYSIQVLINNLEGGRDITKEVTASLSY